MRLGPTELLILLFIVLLLFGAGRITQVARELGQGIRVFREEVQGDETPSGVPQEVKDENASDDV